MADETVDRIMEATRGMGACELRRAVELLKVLLVRELAGPEGEPASCPWCGSERVWRKGWQAGGKTFPEPTRRWLCPACGRTFTRRTLGLLAQSKLDARVWVRFVELMCARRAPLSECAESCGVSAPTAHFMRSRVCQAMELSLPAFSLAAGEGVQVDGTYFNESLKGVGLGKGGPPMPREPHRTGHGVRERGISNKKVCVVCGVSESGDVFAELCDRGRPSDAAVSRALAGRVEGAAVSTDDLGAYARVLPSQGAASHSAFPSDGRAGDGLSAVNALHRRLGDFLRPFNGVSTRRFDMYLAWFRWEELVRRGGADRVEEGLSVLAGGRYFLTRSMFSSAARPFFDYWEGKEPEIDAVAIWGEEAA